MNKPSGLVDLAGSPFDGRKAKVPKAYIVTLQVSIKVDALDQKHAEFLINSGITLPIRFAPYVVGIGCEAQELTPELIKQMEEMEAQHDRTNPSNDAGTEREG